MSVMVNDILFKTWVITWLERVLWTGSVHPSVHYQSYPG